MLRRFTQQFLNLIKEDLKKHPVIIYSTSTCPYCTYAKSTFDELEVKYHDEVLDRIPEGQQKAKGLLDMTGMRTVPNIFIHSQHIGGFSELVKGLQEGTVQDILDEAKIPYKLPKS